MKQNLINEEKIEWLKLNYQILGYKKCSEFLKISPSQTRKLAAKLSLTRKLIKPFSKLNDAQINFIRCNFKILGPKQCAEKLGITKGHVGKIARQFNLWMEEKYDHNILKENMEKLDTPEIAYVLGLIWADGHVDKYSVIALNAEEDMKIILPVFRKIGDWGISLVKKYKDSWKNVSRLKCSNKEIADIFRKFDFDQKSWAAPSKILTALKKEVHHYFWRGYFDGDGCLFVGKNNQKGMSIHSTYEQDWGVMEKLFMDLGINYSIKRMTVESSGYKKSSINSTDFVSIIKFCNYIYQNYEIDKIGFPRKWEKFQILLKRFENCRYTKFQLETIAV